jgi:Icc protein
MLIAQLSDPHLRPASRLYKDLVDSNAMFEAAVAQVNALRPNLVIVTGDIVDEGDPAEYETARRLMDAIAPPWVAIPGNHDEREGFRATFADRLPLPAEGPLNYVAAEAGPVRIVALDVTVPGFHHGEVDAAAAAWLDEALAQAPGRPTIVMLHHHPFESGIACLDPYRCFGAERLEAVIARHPAVERVLCGHVHRFMTRRLGRTLLCTAPSTATAIALRLDPEAEPASYLEPPGLLLHRWSEEAGITTHLVPIGTFPGPFAFF